MMNLQIRHLFPALSLCALLFITGCGTQYAYHQTESEVQEFKNLSLESFIREKIIDSHPMSTKAVLNAFEPLSKVVSTVYGGRSIQEELDYRKQNFIYKALFDYRYHALTKPKKDLELFCKSNGGTLHVKHLDTTNLASGSVLDPLEAYVSVMKRNTKGIDSEIRITPDLSIPLHASKEQIAESYARMIDKKNQQSGIYQADKSINDAINQESFGTFACIKNNKTPLWSVNIMPLILEYAGSPLDHQPLYRMYIGVVPLRSQEKSLR